MSFYLPVVRWIIPKSGAGPVLPPSFGRGGEGQAPFYPHQGGAWTACQQIIRFINKILISFTAMVVTKKSQL